MVPGELVILERYDRVKSGFRNIIEWILTYLGCVGIWFAIFSTFGIKASISGEPIPWSFIFFGASAIGLDMIAMIITGRLFSHEKRNWIYRDEWEKYQRKTKTLNSDK